jgi:hypothetical protein
MRGGEEMCFERRDRGDESSRGQRPTREDIRELFERYERPIRVSKDVGEGAESTRLNGHAERAETVSWSAHDEPVEMR